MRFLVAGADRVDAGKTTFSVGLVDRTGARAFKPRAGNDYWFDHDDVRSATGEGRMYGKDARRLATAAPGSVDPEDINPVHRLWGPFPGPESGLVGPADRRFLLDRVDRSFVVNAGADLPAMARDRLPVSDAVAVSSVEELNEVSARRHLTALRAVGRRIVDRETAVVESYGDVARPLQGSLPEGADATDLYDAVGVVEPGRVRVYDGERFVRACEVARASPVDGQLERRVEDAIKHLDPIASRPLPPLGKDERTDPAAIADAYAPAYDDLIEAAE
ncbi:ATPase [Halobacteriales archaeon QS_8_69_26]|nr:MAG: ATPase [Halobacteriales archaeon QS_8_69_26]